MIHKLTGLDKEKVLSITQKHHLEQSEMEYVVEKYIYARTGEKIDIDITAGIPRFMMPIMGSRINRQLLLLDGAYNIALGWFSNNKEKV